MVGNGYMLQGFRSKSPNNNCQIITLLKGSKKIEARNLGVLSRKSWLPLELKQQETRSKDYKELKSLETQSQGKEL